ncbi:MAG: LCP family protein [Chloroflexota bacterium]|nr:LCP family protein [Chloroflexota bacterium]
MGRIIVFMAVIASFVYVGRAQDITPTPSPDDTPDAMVLASEGGYDITNYLLLGSDTPNPNNSGRTDVMVVVSVNHTQQTASLLSIPRDLYVYVPGHMMTRINTTYAYGEQATDGGGYTLLRETIAYNLGLTVDYYARVNFSSFREIIDSLGGIDVSVDCGIQDWRLKSPELDPQVEDNWELFTLPIGVHELDGNLALWYARSRRTSSDFDRGRRHQVILRAVLARVRSLGLLEQMTELYPQVMEIVETDIPPQEIARLIPLATSLTSSQIASYTFTPNVDVRSWRAPDGASVQAPVRDAIGRLMQLFLTPPTEFQLRREQPRIEIVNASGFDDLGVVAAERLAWEGFAVTLADETLRYQNRTTIIDYTGHSKGSSLALIQDVMRVPTDDVSVTPDPERRVDFRITLGGTYHACTYNVIPPEPPIAEALPEPTATPGA